MEQKQRAKIEAHHQERLNKLSTKSTDTLDASYIMLVEIRDLLLQLVEGEATKAGKTPEKRDPLPKAEYKKGKRKWLWFK